MHVWPVVHVWRRSGRRRLVSIRVRRDQTRRWTFAIMMYTWWRASLARREEFKVTRPVWRHRSVELELTRIAWIYLNKWKKKKKRSEIIISTETGITHIHTHICSRGNVGKHRFLYFVLSEDFVQTYLLPFRRPIGTMAMHQTQSVQWYEPMSIGRTDN